MEKSIFINPIDNYEIIKNKKCNCDDCVYPPEIEVKFFKRKEEDEFIGKSIELYFCRNHFIEYKEIFFKKYERLEKYYTLLAQKEREIVHLQSKMKNGEELE